MDARKKRVEVPDRYQAKEVRKPIEDENIGELIPFKEKPENEISTRKVGDKWILKTVRTFLFLTTILTFLYGFLKDDSTVIIIAFVNSLLFIFSFLAKYIWQK